MTELQRITPGRQLVGFLLVAAVGLAVGYGLGVLLGSWLLQRVGH